MYFIWIIFQSICASSKLFFNKVSSIKLHFNQTSLKLYLIQIIFNQTVLHSNYYYILIIFIFNQIIFQSKSTSIKLHVNQIMSFKLYSNQIISIQFVLQSNYIHSIYTSIKLYINQIKFQSTYYQIIRQLNCAAINLHLNFIIFIIKL